MAKAELFRQQPLHHRCVGAYAMRLLLTALLVMAPRLEAQTVAAQTRATQTEVTRSHTLELEGVTQLSLVNAVGDIDVTLTDGERLQLSVVIKGDRRVWVGSRRDVSEIDVDIRRQAAALRLALEEKNISARWQLRMPRSWRGELQITSGVGDVAVDALANRLEIDLGVGSVDVRLPDGASDVDVGVGNIKISSRKASAGNVRGSVGVGEVTITGEGLDSRGRGVVRVSAAGSGDKEIAATAGVGDVEVVLTRP